MATTVGKHRSETSNRVKLQVIERPNSKIDQKNPKIKLYKKI